MTSLINPNNIDTAYPVAGQDNSTQGFRTNFTNIKQNFQYAEDEINALQSTVAVTNGPNNFNNNVLYAAKFQDVAFAKITNSSASGAIILNFASGSYYSLVTAGSTSVTFSNWPTAPSSSVGYLRLQVEVTSTAHTLTIAADNTGGGAALINAAQLRGYVATNAYSGVITFPAVGYYDFEFACSDGGAEVIVTQISHTAFNATAEDLANAGAASLAVNTSYFATTGAETATLAAGVAGQIKVFAMTADGGDMVITVTNAGWKTSGTGTVTFNDIGDACTLQYINSKWYCIGNNGCAFA